MADSSKVFISYAREDKRQALRLYRDLKALGAQPWIDITDMLPGGAWKRQIEEALDACDYVVLLLSHNSIEKRGYVQVEKRYVLELLKQMPEGSIFLVPVRLEECRPLQSQIRDIHWVDLFPSWDEGLMKIAKSLGLPEQDISELQTRPSQEHYDAKLLSLKDYFEIILPTMLRWKGEEATKLKKKVRFVLLDKPDEHWTIKFEPPAATVVSKDPGKEDLLIKVTSDSMQSILAGEFDARKAIANGNIELSGDLNLLKEVGLLFSGGQ